MKPVLLAGYLFYRFCLICLAAILVKQCYEFGVDTTFISHALDQGIPLSDFTLDIVFRIADILVTLTVLFFFCFPERLLQYKTGYRCRESTEEYGK